MKILQLLFLLACAGMLNAQQNLDYQKPPEEILELVDIERAPSVSMNEEKTLMILLYRDAYKSIEELSKDELRLAGLRIDPSVNIGSRTTFINNIRIKRLNEGDGEPVQVKGLPATV